MQGGNDEMRRAFRERADELARREQQAEAKLAEMRTAIERLRREREARLLEFSDLTRPKTPPPAAAAATSPADDASDAPVSAPETVVPTVVASPEAPAAASPSTGRARRTWTPGRILAAAVVSGLVLGATVAWLWVWFERSPVGPAGQAPAAARPGTVAPAATERASQSTAPAEAAAQPLRVDLAVSRNAWLRASADGRTLVNRTVRAGEQLSLTGAGAIEVRFGDAGAVRVRVDGEDRGPAGRDGQVLTTRFTNRGSSNPNP